MPLRKSLWLGLTFLALCVAGCATKAPPPPPPPPPPPIQIAPPSPPSAPKPVSKPVPVAVVAAPEPVTFLLSGSSDVYVSLTNQVKQQLKAPTFQFILPPDADFSPALKSHLASVQGPIVAIGLDAARAAANLASRRDVIFALVYNFREHHLLKNGAIGVSMLADPQQTLKLLQELSPGVKRLAIATGAKGDDYQELIGEAAKRLGISLVTREVTSDKELLLFATELDPGTQAFWLLPDNRVISRDMIQQLLTVHVKNGRATIVYAPNLLKYGGLISAQFDSAAIAAKLTQILKYPPQERARLRGTLLQPSGALLSINGELARTYGMKIPASRRHLVQETK